MSTARILVAEDDIHIRIGLTDSLESEGYEVTAAHDGEHAQRLWRLGAFDLVLLDIMMPGRSGYDVCRHIRREDPAIPILLVSARSEEIDKVVGLELGADDYITKPFGVRELLARISSALRRSRLHKTSEAGPVLPAIIALGDASVDRKAFIMRGPSGELPMTRREMDLIECLASHSGEAVSRETLLRDAWGLSYGGTTRTLDQHVAQLRKKLSDVGAESDIVETVHGIGYRLKS